MRKYIIVWYKAVFMNYPFWRVKYKDTGETTRLLYYGEASGLRDCFGGKLFIDYNFGKKYPY